MTNETIVVDSSHSLLEPSTTLKNVYYASYAHGAKFTPDLVLNSYRQRVRKVLEQIAKEHPNKKIDVKYEKHSIFVDIIKEEAARF